MTPSDTTTSLSLYTSVPLNGGPRLEDLIQSFVTPVPFFFIRNHGTIPMINPSSYRLLVDGMVKTPLVLSLEDLHKTFPRRTLAATIQCAGNRRRELYKIAPIPDELPWGAEALGNATWSGYPLADILEEAGVLSGASHIAFTGADQIEKNEKVIPFGASISLAKGQSPEVLLADSMNQAPLTLAHGAPLRVVVPGYIGARSVKWLARITVQDHPSRNFYQDRAYRLFAPEITPKTADWDTAPMIEQIPVNAAICVISKGAQVKAGRLLIKGYALGQGMIPLARVEVSPDGGKHWLAARLLAEQAPWAWCLWEVDLPLDAVPGPLVVRAEDQLKNTQPRLLKTVWNFKGYLNNAWQVSPLEEYLETE